MAVLIRHLIRHLLGGILAAGVLCSPAAADSLRPGEYELKGAFLYNFARFVEWPASAFEGRKGFEFCTLSGKDVYDALRRVINDRQIAGRPVNIRRTEKPEESCHVLFVSKEARFPIREVASAATRWKTLTVGEADGFARQGGMIRFFNVDKKLRFEINRSAAESAGLQLNAQLLQLAHLFEDETSAEKN